MPLNYSNSQHEYIKNQKLKKDDVQQLQEWLQKQPHLPQIREINLISFLLSCNYSLEMAKGTIDAHYTLKGLIPELFGKRDLKTWEETFENAFLLPLPKWTPEGYQILYTKLRNKDPSKFNFFNTAHCSQVALKMSLLEKELANGLIFIFDWENVSLGHVARMPLTTVKKLITFLQEGLPIQLKQLHLINTNAYLEKFMALVTPFLKSGLMEIIHLHSDYRKTLFNYVAPECLPRELGGGSDSIEYLLDQTKAFVFANEDFLEEEAKEVADESKRPQKCNKFDYLFGIEGSFRKLELD